MLGPEELRHDLDLSPVLPKDVHEIAVAQGENPSLKYALIQELRNMIFEKGDCNPNRMDDEYLIKFLRSRFWKVENAYKLLCRYYNFREENRELYEKVNPEDLRHFGEDDVISVTPYIDQTGRRIIIYKFGNWNTSKDSVDDLLKATLLIMELGSMEPRAQILGGVGIFDLEGLSFSHILHLTPSVVQKVISLIVTSMPIRTTAIHVVNQNWVFNAGFQIFKPFINAKMRERIFIHGTDWQGLHQYIKPEHLPDRYGGTQQHYSYSYWWNSLSKNVEVLKQMNQLGYDVRPRQNTN